MKMLTKEDILSAPDRMNKTVDVPEWGGSVIVKHWDGRDRDELEDIMVKRSKFKGTANESLDLKAEALVLALVDENEKRLFSKSDIVALNKKNGKVIDRLFDVLTDLNGIGSKAVTSAEKNLGAVVNGDTGSVLPVK